MEHQGRQSSYGCCLWGHLSAETWNGFFHDELEGQEWDRKIKAAAKQTAEYRQRPDTNSWSETWDLFSPGIAVFEAQWACQELFLLKISILRTVFQMSLGQPFKNSKWLWQVGSCIYLQQVGVLQHHIILLLLLTTFRTQQPERWHVHRNQNILIQRRNHVIALNILFVFKALNGWTPQHIWLTVVPTFGTNLLPFNQKHVEFTWNKSAEWIKLLSISFVKTWDALVDQLTSFRHISIHFATVCFPTMVIALFV